MNETLHAISRKIIFIFAFLGLSSQYLKAATGDTIHVQGFNHFLHQNCNVGNNTYLFPPDSINIYKILLRYELSCPPGLGCDIYDRIATLKVLHHTGRMDSTLTLAPSFKVNGVSPDSLQFMTDTSYHYSYDTIAHHIDSTAFNSLQVILYNNPNFPLQPTDTLHVWQAYYNQYTFNASGIATDSVFVIPDSVIYLTVDSIYTPFEVIDPFEIARAITPYGQGVVLWFDVSDYRPILQDSVALNSRACGYSNGWEVSTDFYLIEGVPPMHPYKVVNLWNGTFPYGKTSNPIDSHLQPITLHVDSQSVYEKVRLITTGHGFGCSPNQNVAEFFNVTHSLVINGVSKPQHLWRDDCGLNPLYPQGAPGYTSTWFYKRANWCPGSYVTPHDYDATALVGTSDTLRVDYNMVNYTVTAVPSGAYAPEYYIQSHAFFYDSIAYSENAAVLEIRKPNDVFQFRRINPICESFSPEIIIKNYGRNPLQQLSVHYGIDGTYSNTFAWTGNLAMTASATVTLPPVSFGSGTHTFDVFIDQPNNLADEFAYDDTLHASFTATNVYNTNFIVIALKTDNSPAQSSWNVKDDAGTILFSRTGFTSQLTFYVDTLVLGNGCYTITVNDVNGDGVCCYNGSGTLTIFQGGSTTPIVNSGDFGHSFTLNLTLDLQSGIEEPAITNSVFVYPNPASDKVTLNTPFENGTVQVELFDMTGRIVSKWEGVQVAGHSAELTLPDATDGIYHMRIQKSDRVFIKRMMIKRK